MNDQTEKAILNGIADQARDLMMEQQKSIFADFKRAFDETDKEKFAFPVRITARIIPVGEATDLEISLGHGVNTKHTTGITISDQPDFLKA